MQRRQCCDLLRTDDLSPVRPSSFRACLGWTLVSSPNHGGGVRDFAERLGPTLPRDGVGIRRVGCGPRCVSSRELMPSSVVDVLKHSSPPYPPFNPTANTGGRF